MKTKSINYLKSLIWIKITVKIKKYDIQFYIQMKKQKTLTSSRTYF